MLSRITKNNIYDYSDRSKNSQFDDLPQDIMSEYEKLNKKQFNIENVVSRKISNIMKSSLSLKEKLAKVKKVDAANNSEHAHKEVCRFM